MPEIKQPTATPAPQKGIKQDKPAVTRQTKEDKQASNRQTK